MGETGQNIKRRKFIAVCSAAIATPLILNLADSFEEAKAAEKSTGKKTRSISLPINA